MCKYSSWVIRMANHALVHPNHPSWLTEESLSDFAKFVHSVFDGPNGRPLQAVQDSIREQLSGNSLSTMLLLGDTEGATTTIGWSTILPLHADVYPMASKGELSTSDITAEGVVGQDGLTQGRCHHLLLFSLWIAPEHRRGIRVWTHLFQHLQLLLTFMAGRDDPLQVRLLIEASNRMIAAHLERWGHPALPVLSRDGHPLYELSIEQPTLLPA